MSSWTSSSTKFYSSWLQFLLLLFHKEQCLHLQFLSKQNHSIVQHLRLLDNPQKQVRQLLKFQDLLHILLDHLNYLLLSNLIHSILLFHFLVDYLHQMLVLPFVCQHHLEYILLCLSLQLQSNLYHHKILLMLKEEVHFLQKLKLPFGCQHLQCLKQV